MTEEKCERLSDEMSKGTPKREIHNAMRAWAHANVVVSQRGIASGHRVVLSTMGKIYEKPLDGGRGIQDLC